MRIAVLMTCYNRYEVTRRCLVRLFESVLKDGIDYDVWLVDAASPDRTGNRIKKEFARVNLICCEGLYWCRGMHLAWRSARTAYDYDYYLWLNDDVLLNGDALVTAVNDADEKDNRVIVCGELTEDGTRGSKVTYGLGTEGAMSGNFVLVPRYVFDKLGYIYAGYRHAYGDYDYAIQARKRGIEVVKCSVVVGACRRDPSRYSRLDGKSLLRRIPLLWDVKGYNLHDGVLFKYRRAGIWGALASCLHILWIVIRGR